MGLLDNLEHGLEKAVRSAFSAGGSRAVKPVEVASALRHAMDDESVALSEGHTVAPNDFVVHFSDADFERARGWGSTLASQLCDEVIRHAESQGYALPGSVRVAFHADDDVRPGRLRVVARLDDGRSTSGVAGSAPAQPASVRAEPEPVAAPSAHPVRGAAPRRAMVRDADLQPTVVVPRGGDAVPALELGGRLHRLEGPDLVLGRSPERADVVVPDTSVSREHARLVRAGSAVTLIDLGSRNGVRVNGRRVDGSTTLREGDRITVGQTDLVFHAAMERTGA